MVTILKNNKGSAIGITLIAAAAISIGGYFIAGRLIDQKKISSNLKKNIHVNLALRSISDYVSYGLKKGWCFDDTLLPEEPENCVGRFDNEASSFRLLLPLGYQKSLFDTRISGID